LWNESVEEYPPIYGDSRLLKESKTDSSDTYNVPTNLDTKYRSGTGAG